MKEKRREQGQGTAPDTFCNYALFKVKAEAIVNTFLSKLCIAFTSQYFKAQRLCSIHGIIAVSTESFFRPTLIRV